MASGNAGWKHLDIDSGQLPEESRPSKLPDGGGGRIVVIVATPKVQAEGWASRAVVAIARGWAEEGLRIFLMDLGLENPTLHEVLNLPNEDGVSDAFLYGASVQHIARPALDETIFFAPAGTATADPEEVLGHARWDDLAGGFSEADATLLLFLPSDIPGAAGILSRATDVLFLAKEAESEEEHLGPAAVKVVAKLGPSDSPGVLEDLQVAEGPLDPGTLTAETLTGDLVLDGGDFVLEQGAEEAPGFGLEEGLELSEDFEVFGSEGTVEIQEEVSALDEAIGDAPALDPGGGASDDVPDFGAEFADMPSLEEEVAVLPPEADPLEGLVQGSDFGGSEPLDEDPFVAPAVEEEAPEFQEEGSGDEVAPAGGGRERPRPTLSPKKTFTPGRLIGLLGVVLVLGAAGLTASGVLNIPGFTFLQRYFNEIPDPPLTLAGPQSTDPLLSYSVELDSEDDLSLAVRHLDAWRDRFPTLLFTLVPMELDGMLSYSVLAGPAVDEIQAMALRDQLAAIDRPEVWQIRETPRGFLLGRLESLTEARNLLSTVEGEGIFGIVLQVNLTDGTEGYDVFAGAYEGIADARPLQMVLRRAGFPDAPLIERRGRRPE